MPGARLHLQARLLYALLAILLLVSASYRVLDIGERLAELRNGATYVRDPLDPDLPEYVVQGVEDEAARAGLMPGDRIVSVNGRPVHYSGTDLWAPLRAARAGDTLTIESIRTAGGREVTSTSRITLQPLRTGPPSAIEIASFAIVNVAMPIVCLAIGFWVAAVRIRDGRAWLLLFLMLSIAEFAGGNFHFLYGRQDWFQPIAAAYQPVLANFWPTAMLLFAIYFPERLAIDRRVPWLKWLLIAPVAVRVIGLNPVFEFVARRDADAALALHRALEPTANYVGFSFLLFLVAFFAIMGYRTVTERQPDARRRLRLLVAGAVVSVLPAIVFLIVFLVGRRAFADWLAFPILGFLFVFPLTMAYVIVVERALDVRVVIRQGLQYLLARGTLRVLQLACLTLAATMATMSLSAGTRTGQVAGAAAGIATVVLIQRFGKTLAARVDRRFFRDAYDAERILTDLAGEVRTMVETRPLLQTVTERIAGTLHVPRVAVLVDEGGVLQPAYAVGYAHAEQLTMPRDGSLAHRLQREPYVAVDAATMDEASPGERRSLSQLDPQLLLPLSVNQKLLGVMSLGPKRSEEPYSGSDLRLLRAVSTQTGLALENSRLTTQIASEIAEREKRKRELEIARDVQQRLFPQDCPPVPTIEYAGYCRPALEVGGDYYDFIPLSATELGIAIGDISGKGIPAALLMATLRAFLRGQTMQQSDGNLARLMTNLNALVYESSATNRYATFFYAHYDAASRTLRYVNAGHNPPMLFRCGDGEAARVERLDVGGPVIGLLPACAYEEAAVTLGSGDLLVAFTDGISEAMNASDEDWGEERLMAAIARERALASRELITHVLAAADAFAGSAPQHDDMTVVVVRSV